MTHKAKSAGLRLNSAITNGADEKYYIVDGLIRMSVSNAEFYQHDQSSVGVKLHAIFEKIVDFLEKSLPVIQQIEGFAGQYDFDQHTRGNGYRSFVYIFDSAAKHTEKICQYITENRGNLLFRKSSYMR